MYNYTLEEALDYVNAELEDAYELHNITESTFTALENFEILPSEAMDIFEQIYEMTCNDEVFTEASQDQMLSEIKKYVKSSESILKKYKDTGRIDEKLAKVTIIEGKKKIHKIVTIVATAVSVAGTIAMAFPLTALVGAIVTTVSLITAFIAACIYSSKDEKIKNAVDDVVGDIIIDIDNLIDDIEEKDPKDASKLKNSVRTLKEARARLDKKISDQEPQTNYNYNYNY